MTKMRVSAAVILLASLVLVQSPGPSAQSGNGAPAQGAPQGSAPAAPDSAGAPQEQAGAQADPDAAPQQPTFRGEIDFVRVDVFATDRSGKPITDLTEKDFEISEDGKPMTVEQFKAIRVDGPIDPDAEPPRRIRNVADEEMEAQRDDVRLFVFFLDEYHVRDSNAIRVREPLTKFIETQIRPTDMLAIMYPLTPSDDVIFTRDHEAIVNALQKFEGRKYKYEARNAFERNYEREPTEVVERIRNQVVMGALEGLSHRLGGLRDGRKSVVFVSEGFTVALPAQMRRGDALAPQSPLSGSVVDSRAEELGQIQGQFYIESRMREVYRAAVRNNTSFYTLDPRGLPVFEFDINDGGASGVIGQKQDAQMLRSTQETLRTLATETDGRAILNQNDLGPGLAQMVRDSSFYYLLGYTTPTPPDGKFHEIRVRVTRPGVSIRSRKGYWALSAAEVTRINAPKEPPVPQPVQQALASLAAPIQAARFVRTWVGTERAENGKTRVTLVWEPLPIQQGVRREQAGRISLLAADAQGSLVYRGRSPEAGASSPAATTAARPPAPGPARPGALAPAPTPHRIVFDAPPGKLDLRMTIEGDVGGTLDTETRSVEVPDLTKPQAALSTPRVFRARNAREFQAQAGDAAAIPATGREFSRSERLLIRFDVYAAGAETPTPTAVVLNRAGQKMHDLTVTPATAGGTHQVDLSLNTVPSGDYVVEITVKGATGDEAKELVPVRIGA